MIKNKNCGRFTDRQRKGVGVGEKKKRRALADAFEKNEKKNKTTSVYKLQLSRPGVDLIRAHQHGIAI